MRKRTFLATLAVVIAGAVTLVGCGPAENTTSAQPDKPAATEQAKKKADNTTSPTKAAEKPKQTEEPKPAETVKSPKCPGQWFANGEKVSTPYPGYKPVKVSEPAVSELTYVGSGYDSCYDSVLIKVGSKDPTYRAVHKGNELRLTIDAPPTDAFDKPAGTALKAKQTDKLKTIKSVTSGGSSNGTTVIVIDTAGQPFRVYPAEPKDEPNTKLLLVSVLHK